MLRYWTYEDLHDLIKDEPLARPGTGARSEQKITKLKRKWIANQLHKLAERHLLQITERPGSTPQLTVLRDDGSGQPYDDPGGAVPFEPYFTIHGSLIASGELLAWEASELAAYFACLLAEFRYDRGADRKIRPGHGTWSPSHPRPPMRRSRPRGRTKLSYTVLSYTGADLASALGITFAPSREGLDAQRKLGLDIRSTRGDNDTVLHMPNVAISTAITSCASSTSILTTPHTHRRQRDPRCFGAALEAVFENGKMGTAA